MKSGETENFHRLRLGSGLMGSVMMATLNVRFISRICLLSGELFRIGRWFDGMIPSPGPPFLNREAATMLPALLRRAAATGVILTREGDALLFETRGGQRHSEAAHEKG